ncbi:MAG TPA: L-aspartate oxidase [Elusimicrobia bacterium]|nr:MAG: L-aspartate oxidase [Elusimicrobia bacterium RIFOXYA12_FULL_49_49]OGS09317.1 MAG: L-aspartate oxidase [Elusimicrobia bacterium RIFOXYB1_FULL_48_9]OGS16200.1 MAG: L-aspartate oxidase [Elusimicrobia bacterium RIFOXYA2_FULL_47_53]OGS26601.1 MAG: L-aspartate oxidase [Elusimicrobia bacterium RIFOXYB12_FULL_50_12]OGS31354.1 MAG: L-aspartate oxidase [Elusimicrobia bacterium RIFOXYB2_FULL_46_23]HBU69543.1 L-aspartate oxidase [Elusimicrobiota bacterium]
MIKTDYLVIGSGIAGLSFALKAAGKGTVAVVSKKQLSDAATNYAQGGIAAVWSREDSFEEHIQDTCEAGAGLCNPEVAGVVVREGPQRIKELVEIGVNFAVTEGKTENDFELGLEGGHSKRRIFHSGDATGAAIEKTLIESAKKNSNIIFYENHIAIDLITTGKLKRKFAGKDEKCWGAYVLDTKGKKVITFLARAVVLAAGGAGKVYLYTTNPDISTGDGMAMAYRCGATLANMEFVQFHPTCLFHPRAKSFLISEALRGEGARLLKKDGSPFMEKYHKLKELAPRDIVARAIDAELKESGDDHVYLDITHRPADFVKKRFPNIYQKCLEFGIDITKNYIPVVPAAHYFCGGVVSDLHGQTSVRNLFAIGETAFTGLHGANRLASNSLLEALVFAHRAGEKASECVSENDEFPSVPQWDIGHATDSSESVVVSQNWEEIRHFMWNYVGIVRSNKRLERAKRRIDLLLAEISEYYWDFIVTSDLIELRNIAAVADLVIRSAQGRKESRGLHYNIDFPGLDKSAKDTYIRRFDNKP